MKNTEVLNDLIEINNDRVAGYEKAAKESKDSDLCTLFQDLANESKKLASELRSRVEPGEESPTGGTVRGSIYRTWMDVKAKFGGDDRKSLLASCEFGEDAAQDAYKRALNTEGISPEVRTVIENQKTVLRQSHDKIKRMRDGAPA